jgi:adenylate cyclase
MKLSAFLGCFVFLLTSIGQAQNHEIDSLKSLVAASGNDTLRVKTLLALSSEYFSIDPREAIRYAEEARTLSTQLGYNAGVALAHKQIGIGYFNQAQYIEALQQYELSLSTYEAIGDKRGMATILKNTGNIYYNKGDDDKALEYYFRSLKVSESIPDEQKVMESLGNIGAVYMNKPATRQQAFDHLRRAYPLSKKLNDHNAIGAIAVNLGELHMADGRYDSAMLYLNESLKAYEVTGDVAYTLNDIGKLYRLQKQYDQAVAIQQRALKISKELDSQDDVATSLLGIAQSYEESGDLQNALVYYKQADTAANTADAKYTLVDIYLGMARTFAGLGNYADAYTYRLKMAEIKDAIYNLEIDRKLGTLQFTYDLEKKSAEISSLNKDREMKAKELSRQKLVRNSFIVGFALLLVVAIIIFSQRNRIAKEKKRSEALLLNILPEETAHELKETGKAKAHRYESVSVLFTDFKGFSTKAEQMMPEEVVDVLDFYFRAFDHIIEKYGLEKIKTIGDAYMCAGGLPTVDKNHAIKVVKAAIDMREFVAKQAMHRFMKGLPFFEIRIGVNSGPVVAGVVGDKKFAYDIWGDTVNMAARMEQSGVPGKINISGTTYELIKDRFVCTHRGKVNVKHRDDVEMYFAEEEKRDSFLHRSFEQPFEVDAQHPLLKNAIKMTHDSQHHKSQIVDKKV